MRKMRKGFTLVELLIVIAVIAVLASMMTLSSGDAASAAKAASVANGYKVIGTAFVVYHSVSGDDSTADYFNGKTAGEDGEGGLPGVSPDYVGPQIKSLGSYKVIQEGTGSSRKFYVEYNFGTDTALRDKFLTYSKDMGMIGESTKPKMRIY